MNSKEFTKFIKKETQEIVNDLQNLNSNWIKFDNHKSKNDDNSQKNYGLYSSFYFYMKKISDICQDSNEIFGSVLQELQIAKSNRNIDENIVYEIANETEKLSGVLKHVKREENNMITKIEQYLQDSKHQQIEAEKSMVNLPGIYPTDKRKTTKLGEFIDRVFHIFLPTVTADHNSNDEISIPCSTNLENSANTVSKDSINSFETVKSLQNCNEKEHVSPLLKGNITLEVILYLDKINHLLI